MPNFIEGEVLLIDKPLTWTSFDAVNKLKYALQRSTGLKKIKVGHAGTLDPLASGLLIVCTGKKTKTIESIQGLKKEYTGIIQFGATTSSYDLETEPENFQDTSHLTETQLHHVAKNMEGESDQLPPIFSAKKIDGKRAYDLARAGKNPEMKTKRVAIYSFEIEKVEGVELHFRIICSKGTYIRSIAHDFGKAIGVGGYLKALRRTKIGDFDVITAMTIDAACSYVEEHSLV
ncbi:tRNA pseudouridine(55) synthase TruB [Vicingaceae bacterium]|nr:tRNA pseudouridine(55) synthase TruB [Vicingaceae bacterium]MDB4060985.1 tRNA pseudouridine(55) synthase TruB [Vicingaceae bacterium]MDC0004748.1 tRNA pseudouridine(55) synthase TruB [bacterium]MDC1450925.1 tRNA pseudouridine(55) synthase TruB [Vicingaceae bacterium]